MIPSYATCFFKDGNQWCCVFGDFINLQESLSGFGPSWEDSLSDLERNVAAELAKVQP